MTAPKLTAEQEGLDYWRDRCAKAEVGFVRQAQRLESAERVVDLVTMNLHAAQAIARAAEEHRRNFPKEPDNGS